MRWSLKLGTVSGIAVHVHVTVALLLAFVVASAMAGGQGLVAGLLLAAAAVATLLVHEVAHVLVSRARDVEVREATLHALGGIARTDRTHSDARTEWLVALAGPSSNVAFALLLLGTLLALGAPLSFGQSPLVGAGILSQLMWANLLLAAINVLPGLPMDGGHLLRARLSERDPVRAAHVALAVGQGLALALAFAGLFVSPSLVFVGLLVWLGAAAEVTPEKRVSTGPGLHVREAMVTDYRSLSPDQPLEVAVDHIRAGFDQDFPVTQEGRLVGLLTRNDLLVAFANLGRQAAVGDAMVKTFRTAEASEPLDAALGRFQTGCRTLPVVDDGRLVGLLGLDDAAALLGLERRIVPTRAPRRERSPQAAAN
jgi:Zn-dependent protease